MSRADLQETEGRRPLRRPRGVEADIQLRLPRGLCVWCIWLPRATAGPLYHPLSLQPSHWFFSALLRPLHPVTSRIGSALWRMPRAQGRCRNVTERPQEWVWACVWEERTVLGLRFDSIFLLHIALWSGSPNKSMWQTQQILEVVLSERSQSQKTTCCMSPCMWNVQNGQR